MLRRTGGFLEPVIGVGDRTAVGVVAAAVVETVSGLTGVFDLATDCTFEASDFVDRVTGVTVAEPECPSVPTTFSL